MPNQVLSIILSLVLLLHCGIASAADEERTVTVSANRPDTVKGLPIRVLKRDPSRGGLVQVKDEEPPVFDEAGRASLSLPVGTYVFEVLHVAEDATIICLQSAPTDLSRTEVVIIAVPDATPVSLAHDKKPMVVREAAVRSAAVRGEVRWKRAADEESPRLVISAKSACTVNVIATQGSVHAAAWLRPDPKSGAAFTTRPDWNTCQFVWNAGQAPAARVTARVASPDAEMDIPVTPETRLVTNRKFWFVGYTAAITDGPVMTFRPVGQNVGRAQKFEFGGPLVPHAWAQSLWHDSGSFHFKWRYALTDSAGRNVVNDDESGITASIARRDGKELPKDKIDDATRKELGDGSKSLAVTVDWTWDGPRSKTVAPQPTVELRSERFKIEAVPFWVWQTRNYLSKMERYHAVEREATGRRGPASINLDWRVNTHNAKAIVGGANGGGQWLWVSLPFAGYEGNHDPWSEPWFVGHEMLHTFGYHHGDEMSRLQGLVEANFADQRWRLVDSPGAELPIEQGVVVPKAVPKK